MPTHEEHCRYSLARYGKRFDALHRWMDEPWEIFGKKHRKYRHDPDTTPREAKKLFGEFADHACLDHILLDRKYQEFNWGIINNTYVWPALKLQGEGNYTDAEKILRTGLDRTIDENDTLGDGYIAHNLANLLSEYEQLEKLKEAEKWYEYARKTMPLDPWKKEAEAGLLRLKGKIKTKKKREFKGHRRRVQKINYGMAWR